MDLLLYFKEDSIELWSIDDNERLIPLEYQSLNKIPLYFLLDKDHILMDNHAKNAYLKRDPGSYGDFWGNFSKQELTFNRFGSNFPCNSLIHYALKETILPSIFNKYFGSIKISEFSKKSRTFVLFDPFVDDDVKKTISKGLNEITGIALNSIVTLDFWELFSKANNVNESQFVFINASLGNLYIDCVTANNPYSSVRKVIEGKGRDPRVDTILDFIADIAIAKGSHFSPLSIKREIESEGPKVLGLLDKGLVIYEIKNDAIGINPLRLNFHRSEIDGKLENKQSLYQLQNEFDIFRKLNNAENLPIYLFGEVINQNVFADFFKNIYSRVNSEKTNLIPEMLSFGLNSFNRKEASFSKSDLKQMKNPVNPEGEKVESTDSIKNTSSSEQKEENIGSVNVVITDEASQPIPPSTPAPKALDAKEKISEATSEKGKRTSDKANSDKKEDHATKIEPKKSKLLPLLLGIAVFAFLLFQVYQKIGVNGGATELSIAGGNHGDAIVSFSVEFANLSGGDIFIAIGYFTKDWESEGWFELEPNTSKTFNLPANFSQSSVFLFGTDADDNLLWNGNDKYLCIDPYFIFHLFEHKNCEFLEGFKEFHLTGNHTVIEINGIEL
jgi:uncharacterized membrane protein